ncbi:MAG: RidA family protein [Thaumarchaeota archaeon]|nr:RidA family protein [Nitrososphaerota archaeon]
MTKISFINPSEVAAPAGYTHVVSVEDPQKILYVSGQVSKNQKGEIVGRGDLEVQTRQVYANLLAILKSQGASFKNVVKLNTYSTNPEKIDVIRKVRTEFVEGDEPPASTFVGVTALADPAFLVEIELVAVLS